MQDKTNNLTEVTKKDASFLKKFNIAAGILHLVQGAIMLFVSQQSNWEVYISLPEPNTMTRMAFPAFEKLTTLNLGPLVALFLLLSALAHFILILPKINNWYNDNLKKNINIARWYEYALSSSLMLVLVGVLSSVIDFNLLFLIFVLNACMNLFGLSMEKYNSKAKMLDENAKTDWSNYIFGVISGLAPWVVIGLYFFTTLDRVDGQTVSFETAEGIKERVIEIPTFVYYIFFTLIATFNTFAINMFLQYKKIGPWKNYLFGEKVYIVLSLVAKTLLAWQIFGGTLR